MEDILMKSSASAAGPITFEGEKVAIGIDIGIAYSRVTMFRENKFSNIPDEVGRFQTPSYVAFTDTSILIGEDARN